MLAVASTPARRDDRRPAPRGRRRRRRPARRRRPGPTSWSSCRGRAPPRSSPRPATRWAAPARRRSPIPTTPTGSSPSCSPRAPPADPKGAIFTNRELAAITASDVGDAWGGGGAMLASTQFAHVGFMTKLPWYLRLATTTYLLDRWRASDVLRLVAEHRMPSVGGVAPAGRAHAARPRLRLLRPVEREDAHHGRRGLAAGAGRARPASGSARRTRSATRPPSPAASAPAPRSTPTTTRRSSPSGARAATCRSRSATATTGPSPTAGGRAVPAVVVHDARLLERPRRHRRDAARRLDPHRRPGPHRRPRACCASPVARRRCSSAAATTSTRSRSSRCWRRTRRSSTSPSSPAPTTCWARSGWRCWSCRPGATAPTVAELRDFAADRLAAYKRPEAVEVVDELPLTAMQKLDRAALRDQFGGSSDHTG